MIARVGTVLAKKGRIRMRTLLRIFDKAVYAVIFLCIAGFVALSFAQVFCRFILNDSLVWSEELCRYLFVWMVFLGAGVGVLYRKHITIDIVPNLVTGPARKYYLLALDLLVIAFTVYLIRYGYVFAEKAMRQRSPAMQIPLGYVYAGILVGGAVMLINAFRAMFAAFFEVPAAESEPAAAPEMSQDEFNRLLGMEKGGEDRHA